MGRHRRPKFIFTFLLPPPKAAPTGHPGCPKLGAAGAAPPEDERNPAKGGCFASLNLNVDGIVNIDRKQQLKMRKNQNQTFQIGIKLLPQ